MGNTTRRKAIIDSDFVMGRGEQQVLRRSISGTMLQDGQKPKMDDTRSLDRIL